MFPNALIVDAIAQEAVGDSRAAEVDLERALDGGARRTHPPFVITPARSLERHPRHRRRMPRFSRPSSTSCRVRRYAPGLASR
jgi:hypothetical protein